MTETETPRRVTATLLVAQDFADRDGFQWQRGDRAPTARRSVREAAREHPERFLVEHEALPLTQADVDGWLAEVDRAQTAAYQQAKRRRDEEPGRREQALRAELEAQEREPRNPRSLERRYKKQRAEAEARRKRLEEERERRQIEAELEAGVLTGGFHYGD